MIPEQRKVSKEKSSKDLAYIRPLTKCKTKTNTFLEHTKHGVILRTKKSLLESDP